MSQYNFVTTLNKKIYDKFGYKLIESFKKYCFSSKLYIYVDDDISFYPKVNNNIEYHNLLKSEPELKKFIRRNNFLSRSDWIFDPVKFSYKVFAQSAASKFLEHFFYIDADIIFLKKIDADVFNYVSNKKYFLSFFGRQSQYTESGFLSFNCHHSFSNNFFDYYLNFYLSDLIFSLDYWTDCHALDATRMKFKSIEKNYNEFNLGDNKEGNVMDRDSILKPYIKHNKGFLKWA